MENKLKIEGIGLEESIKRLESETEEIKIEIKRIKELIEQIVTNSKGNVLKSVERKNYETELMPYIERKNTEIEEGLSKSIENLKVALKIHTETETITELEAEKL